MNCPKCYQKNDEDHKFCASCGEKLNGSRIVKKGIPVWAWLLTLVCCLVSGGVGYGLWDYFNGEQRASNSNYEEISKLNEIETVQPIPVDAVVEKPEDPQQEDDRVALIKGVQQKVYTILASSGQGSGFLYKKGGYVITNAHVVKGEVDVVVRNSSGQESAATVVGISEKYDIALLHVPEYASIEPLAVEPAESSVGLEVIALGSPLGFENSASIGYITGIGRDIEFGFIYKQIYQVDAQIDQGSSGGPLVDAKTGKVVGINSLLITSETSTNFAFSIPLYSMMQQFDQWVISPLTASEVLAVSRVYNYSAPQTTIETDGELAGQYVQSFRVYYEMALNEGDFYWVADMLDVGSIVYKELEDYIGDIAGQGHSFYFTSNEVLDVTQSGGTYYVYMNETFDFYSAKGDYQFYDRYKTYTVITDANGAFKISDIEIH
ncbi:trypsin-like peptidase domain-containing protein [Solibacillus sp. FSL H8-0538]|uniref:trypsin-like peptidase domain-containing protein n=1 Tax=Solibacillus sp. FSL H8-0538 TaxID=2921400 RepID=UPI0030F9D062